MMVLAPLGREAALQVRVAVSERDNLGFDIPSDCTAFRNWRTPLWVLLRALATNAVTRFIY
jgi:hypothetical protein